MKREKLSIWKTPTSEEFQRSADATYKRFGEENLRRVYNPDIVRVPYYAWTMAISKGQPKIFAGPFDCRSGTKTPPEEAYVKLEELGETGFIHTSKYDKKDKVLEEVRNKFQLMQPIEKKSKLGISRLLKRLGLKKK